MNRIVRIRSDRIGVRFYSAPFRSVPFLFLVRELELLIILSVEYRSAATRHCPILESYFPRSARFPRNTQTPTPTPTLPLTLTRTPTLATTKYSTDFAESTYRRSCRLVSSRRLPPLVVRRSAAACVFCEPSGSEPTSSLGTAPICSVCSLPSGVHLHIQC